MSNTLDIIVGYHSIFHAIENAKRTDKTIYLTEDSHKEFVKYYKLGIDYFSKKKCQLIKFKNNDFQDRAKKIFDEYGLEFKRIPSQIMMTTSSIVVGDHQSLIQKINSTEKLKILCLDSLSDVHNGAAIIRTAAFFKTDCIIVPMKGSFALTPSFYRISSGALEYVDLIKTSNMSRAIAILNENNVTTIGLSEEAKEVFSEENKTSKIALVLGSEEAGLSHAVERLVKHNLCLPTTSPINSLNVSVAAALAMGKVF